MLPLPDIVRLQGSQFHYISGKCSILSSDNILTLHFQTNAYNSYSGFLAKYYAVDKIDLQVNNTAINETDWLQGASFFLLNLRSI